MRSATSLALRSGFLISWTSTSILTLSFFNFETLSKRSTSFLMTSKFAPPLPITTPGLDTNNTILIIVNERSMLICTKPALASFLFKNSRKRWSSSMVAEYSSFSVNHLDFQVKRLPKRKLVGFTFWPIISYFVFVFATFFGFSVFDFDAGFTSFVAFSVGAATAATGLAAGFTIGAVSFVFKITVTWLVRFVIECARPRLTALNRL